MPMRSKSNAQAGLAQQAVGRTLAVLTLLLGVALPQMAFAGGLDLHLDRLIKAPSSNPTDRIDNSAYRLLMHEVSLAIGPRMSGPGQSMGALGMDVSYEISGTGSHSTADYWKKVADKPEATITSQMIRVRKGLPHGLQVGTVLSHIDNSDMWSIGAELNISLIDGFKNVPDVGWRNSLHSVLGNKDMSMVIAGSDLSLSKSFGIAGVLAIQPWATYSLAFTYVSTHQMPYFNSGSATWYDLQTFKQFPETSHLSDGLSHRLAVGVRAVVARVQIGGEFMRSFTDDLNVVTGRVGVNF